MKKLLFVCTLIMAFFITTSSDIFAATRGEQNALKQAEMYSNFMPLSLKGIINQLKFEGYSDAEAEYGANNLKVDWNEQAYKSANKYLELMPMSKQALLQQLKFEGFTSEQAEYGVNKAWD